MRKFFSHLQGPRQEVEVLIWDIVNASLTRARYQSQGRQLSGQARHGGRVDAALLPRKRRENRSNLS